MSVGSLTVNRSWLEAQILEIEANQFAGSPRVDGTGVSFALIQDGKLSLAYGRGWANRESRVPVTTGTVFPIASITKSFTATALVQALAERGLGPETRVQDWVPEFALSQPDISRDATAADLLSHACGLPRHDALWFRARLDGKSLLNRIAHLELFPADGSGFRKSFQYNNLLYGVAGLMTERLTGQSWERIIESRYLKRLGMLNTYMSAPGPEVGNQALPCFREFRCSEFPEWSCAPAGAMHSTASDIAKWLEFQIAEASKLESVWGQTRNRAEGSADSGSCFEQSDYALGWFNDRFSGKRWIHHSGSINGFSLLAGFMPEEKLGLVVLVNQVQTKLTKHLALRVLAKCLGLDATPSDRYRPPSPYNDEGLMPIFPGQPAFRAQDLASREALGKPVLRALVHSLSRGPEFRHPGYGMLRICESNAVPPKQAPSLPAPDLEVLYEQGPAWPAWVVAKDQIVTLVDWLGMPGRLRMRIVSTEPKKVTSVDVPFNINPGVPPTRFTR